MIRQILHQGRKAQRGIALVWLLISMVVIMGFSALSLDTAYWHYEQAQLKRASDAAALAAAYVQTSTTPDASAALTAATKYATWNNAVLSGAPTFPSSHSNWVTASVQIPRPQIFSGIFGIGSATISQTSTAQWYSNINIPAYTNSYGIPANQAFNYSVFGPLADHQWGDEFSTKYLENGALNPKYTGQGYNFPLNVNSNYTSKYGTHLFQVEIFDASCYNGSSGQNYDEMHTINPTITSVDGVTDPNSVTQTWYTVQYEDANGTWHNATNASGGTAQVSYTGESYAHNVWVDNPALQIDMSNSLYATAKGFRVNVDSTDPNGTTTLHGSSENGFQLRVTPPLPAADINSTNYVLNSNPTTGNPGITDTQWNTTYGTSAITLSADTHMQVNFNTTATVTLTLANLPAMPLGGKVTVTRFDTDVLPSTGGTLVYNWPGGSQSFTSQLNSLPQNDMEYPDVITIPSGFAGGLFTASYTAASADTSDWSVTATGPGMISLVATSGQTY